MNGDEASRIINQLIREANQQSGAYSALAPVPISPRQLVCNIVACTANTTNYWKKLARESGMVHMTNKPLNPAKLEEIFAKWYFEDLDLEEEVVQEVNPQVEEIGQRDR